MADACIYLMNLPDEKFLEIVQKGNAPLINIGTGEDLTIHELAELVKEEIGYTGDIVWDSSKPDGTPRKRLDVSRLADLGWQARVDLRNGLRMAIHDFLQRQDHH
jgi:GDP-L-fucose synthase